MGHAGMMSMNGGGETIGWLEVCRRVGVFVLTMPMRGVWVGEPGDAPLQQGGSEGMVERKRRRGSPPLLPVFMHLIMPSVIRYIDKFKSTVQDQTSLIEILTTIVFSSLTAALHLEWALANIGTLLGDSSNNSNVKGITGEGATTATARRIPPVLGASSGSVARRLAADLRARKDSQACRLILERLGSSQSFVANFPYFGSGIEG